MLKKNTNIHLCLFLSSLHSSTKHNEKVFKVFRETKKKKFDMPRAGIEPALSGPQPDVLPLYYRGDTTLTWVDRQLVILKEIFIDWTETKRKYRSSIASWEQKHAVERFRTKKKFDMPRAGIEPALSGPQPDVLPLYYRGDVSNRCPIPNPFVLSNNT